MSNTQIPKSTYFTTDPLIVAIFKATAEKARDVGNAAVAGAEKIGKNKGLMVQRFFGTQRFVGLAPIDPQDPPEGWRYVREQFEPRLGKRGEAARRWLAEHQPPSVRQAMEEQGLPEMTSFKYGFMGVPGMFLHDDTIWAIYKGEPDREPGPAWTKCKPSEFYAAQERQEEAEKAAEAVVNRG